MKLIREHSPDLMAVCVDTPEPTFRDELFEDYKANRKAPPDDLVAQFPYIEPITRILGVTLLKKAGFEADDLIGTLVKKFADIGCGVVVVSGDKDLMQLVGPSVSILDEMKGIWIGPKQVEERFGVEPDKVVEVLGLSGDQSDNVPGVAGVGPKTACTLVKKYGSVENVIANAGELKDSLAEKIREHAADAMLSRKLVEIKTDVELEVGERDLILRGVDISEAKRLLGELEFTKLLSELISEAPAGTDNASARSLEVLSNYDLIADERALESLVSSLKESKAVAIYVLADGKNPVNAAVRGIALSWGAGRTAFIPVSGADREQFGKTADMFLQSEAASKCPPLHLLKKSLGPVIEEEARLKIGHGLNFSQVILSRLGIDVRGRRDDLMLVSYVGNPSDDHSLESLARKLCGTVLQAAMNTDDEACGYACARAEAIWAIHEIMVGRPAHADKESVYREIELPLIDVLVSMELWGIKIDTKLLASVGNEFKNRLVGLEKEIYSAAHERFNINSPKQLGSILFEKLGFPGAKRTKTGFSTSQDVLEELALSHKLPELILKFRSLSKLKSTYVDALAREADSKTQRVHTFFNQAVTATGRLSSSDPNLQNIPARGDEGRRIRSAFIAEKDFLLMSADYSQIELRVLAHMSGDSTLLDAFERGLDVHAITASGILGVPPSRVGADERAMGKTVNFAVIYGQTAFGLSRQLKISVPDAEEYINGYFKKYPGVFEYRESVIKQAARDGFVTTLFGRKRFVPDISSEKDMLAQVARRMAFNAIFQGTSADIIKKAMIEIYSTLGSISPRAKMLLQVHDELLFEVPKDDIKQVEEFVRDKMQNVARLRVPLIVDIGTAENWAEAH